jgi:hypothetical protein
MRSRWPIVLVVVALAAPDVAAQSLGTFRWQLQPFCNVVTVAVVTTPAGFRLEGTDDQCGTATPASVLGTASLNVNGTVTIGLTIVSSPAGVSMPLSATLAPPTFNGSWRDGAGSSGAFTFITGAGTGGPKRPEPIGGLQSSGAFLATGAFGVGAIPASGPGVRMMWYPGKAAFRAGRMFRTFWDDPLVGEASTAFGANTTASGLASLAAGNETTASGQSSFSTGSSTRASGHSSVAFGAQTEASGLNALAMGGGSVASGISSVAMGVDSVAAGDYSLAFGFMSQALGQSSLAGGGGIARGDGAIALGFAETTQGYSFAWGDGSNEEPVIAGNNEWHVRATGGVRFYSDSAMTAGVRLAPGGGGWLGLSDGNSKHAFRDLDGEEVLARLATMPVREWSYKSQDAAIRHIGPTAQDFHAAFGLGEDPLRIGTLDADGVALAAVRALEQRTRALQQDNETLREALAEIRRTLAALTPR